MRSNPMKARPTSLSRLSYRWISMNIAWEACLSASIAANNSPSGTPCRGIFRVKDALLLLFGVLRQLSGRLGVWAIWHR